MKKVGGKNKHCLKETAGILLVDFVKHNIVWMGCIIYIYKIQMQSFQPPQKIGTIFNLFVCWLVRSSISATYNQMFLSCYGYFAEKISCSEGWLCALKVEKKLMLTYGIPVSVDICTDVLAISIKNTTKRH